ncbi:MAG: hypothetical protein Ta2B_20710 [Termitinemataceae bacterium]|nr:MAG: hypothetical protein Ta2B_20710 [Termitinemataceae bacterium]
MDTSDTLPVLATQSAIRRKFIHKHRNNAHCIFRSFGGKAVLLKSAILTEFIKPPAMPVRLGKATPCAGLRGCWHVPPLFLFFLFFAILFSYEEDGKNTSDYIQWHPAFIEALKHDLSSYKDVLTFKDEHQLTAAPLKIDVLVIKKEKMLQSKIK